MIVNGVEERGVEDAGSGIDQDLGKSGGWGRRMYTLRRSVT